MKLILLLVLVLVGAWIWRSNRRAKQGAEQPRQTQTTPQGMVRCRFCAVHLPAAEAVSGKLGVYCCTDHLQLAEHPM